MPAASKSLSPRQQGLLRLTQQAAKLLVTTLLATGCAGASMEMRADTARYPVSLSQVAPGSDGAPLRIGRGLQKVGTFHHDERVFALLYTAIPVKEEVDLSEPLNAAIQQHDGVAVVNLRLVELRHCVTNWFFPLTLLPVWPGCEQAIFEGDIVAIKPPSTGAQ